MSGRRIPRWSMRALVRGVRSELEFFGPIESGDAASALELDDDWARQMEDKRGARQQRLATTTSHYGGFPPEALPTLVTSRVDLEAGPGAFLARGSSPSALFASSGSTGAPRGIWYGRDEIQTMAALGALGAMRRGLICPGDDVVIATPRKMRLAPLVLHRSCDLIGARVLSGAGLSGNRLLDEVLGCTSSRVVLSVTSSTLGELTEAAEARRGRTARVATILTGGEPLTRSLRARAAAVFEGAVIRNVYGTAELLPLGGTVCERGHLHVETVFGRLDVVDGNGMGVPAGVEGRLVGTPFAPFRMVSPLLRYDTGDIVRAGVHAGTCDVPGGRDVGRLLGRAAWAVDLGDGRTLHRSVVSEALESCAGVPLPARFEAHALGQAGISLRVVLREDSAAHRAEVRAALAEHCVEVQHLGVVSSPVELRASTKLRCDAA